MIPWNEKSEKTAMFATDRHLFSLKHEQQQQQQHKLTLSHNNNNDDEVEEDEEDEEDDEDDNNENKTGDAHVNRSRERDK